MTDTPITIRWSNTISNSSGDCYFFFLVCMYLKPKVHIFLDEFSEQWTFIKQGKSPFELICTVRIYPISKLVESQI